MREHYSDETTGRKCPWCDAPEPMLGFWRHAEGCSYVEVTKALFDASESVQGLLWELLELQERR